MCAGNRTTQATQACDLNSTARSGRQANTSAKKATNGGSDGNGHHSANTSANNAQWNLGNQTREPRSNNIAYLPT
jgi:hypothetical protein